MTDFGDAQSVSYEAELDATLPQDDQVQRMFDQAVIDRALGEELEQSVSDPAISKLERTVIANGWGEDVAEIADAVLPTIRSIATQDISTFGRLTSYALTQTREELGVNAALQIARQNVADNFFPHTLSICKDPLNVQPGPDDFDAELNTEKLEELNLSKDDVYWVLEYYGHEILELSLAVRPLNLDRDLERLAFDVYVDGIEGLDYDPPTGSRPPVPRRFYHIIDDVLESPFRLYRWAVEKADSELVDSQE